VKNSQAWQNSGFKGHFSLHTPPKFVIVCGGFVPRCKHLQPFFFSTSPSSSSLSSSSSSSQKESERKALSFPTNSLHVIGETDQMVSYDRQMELYSHWRDPTLFQHSGGHFLPANAKSRDVYKEYLATLPSPSM
jgi:hypothetical protein